MVYLEHKFEEYLLGNFKGSWFTWTVYKNDFLNLIDFYFQHNILFSKCQGYLKIMWGSKNYG